MNIASDVNPKIDWGGILHAPVQYTPLSPEEQIFAEMHHSIIGRFLRSRNLPEDEWYDVVVFRYLHSVKKWFQRPDLHCYKFNTIAWKAMGSAVHNEQEKQKRRIQPVSLDTIIPGTEDMTLMDTITYDNMQYLYTGEENMKISYNVKVPERKRKYAEKSDEVLAIESFILSKTKNMCFEYDTDDEAKRKYNSVRSYRRKAGHQDIYDMFRNDNKIYIVKEAAK